MREQIASPCIRNCCLDPDDICIGCYRHISEITAWHGATTQQKLEILRHTEQRRQAYQIGQLKK